MTQPTAPDRSGRDVLPESHRGVFGAYLSAVVLAHSLGLAVVAEGVETARAWRTLAGWGWDVIQGWYLAKAMPAEEMTAWLARHHGRPVLRALDAEAPVAVAADAG